MPPNVPQNETVIAKGRRIRSYKRERETHSFRKRLCEKKVLKKEKGFNTLFRNMYFLLSEQITFKASIQKASSFLFATHFDKFYSSLFWGVLQSMYEQK